MIYIDDKQFTRKIYQETEIKVGVKDILGAPTDAIVNPANSGLSHGAGLAASIAEAAGEIMEQDCDKIIRKYGNIPATFAVQTRWRQSGPEVLTIRRSRRLLPE